MLTLFKFVFLLFVLIPMLAKSQEDAKAVFISINQHVSDIEESLVKMNISLKKDKHKEVEQQTADIETALGAIEKQSRALPSETGQRILSINDSFKTDLKNFEKMVNKSSLFDNDKTMASAFAPLKSRLGSLRDYLRNAYSAMVGSTEKASPPSPAILQTPQVQPQTPPAQTPTRQPQTPTVQTPQQNTSSEKTEPTPGTSTQSEPQVLDGIRQAERQISGWMDTLQIAVKKSQAVKIRTLVKNIIGSAAKIEDLSLLLKDDQKDNIKTLAQGLKQYAAKLQALSFKGHAVHEQMHETLDLMETRLSVLSTGIGILK